MVTQQVLIDHIPGILWGESSTKMIVAVHGNTSHKADVPIEILAQEAISLGYQVLSFDLPEHGDRKKDGTLCKVQVCVQELMTIMNFAAQLSKSVSLFACSMGAYFSLLAYKNSSLQKSLFLSPVVDMSRIIDNMMTWFQISKEQLQAQGEIFTPAGQTLYWDYYCYVQDNPIVSWNSPTAILYGRQDTLCELDGVVSFTNKFKCSLEIAEQGEHYFHTPEQLLYFRRWLKRHLI